MVAPLEGESDQRRVCWRLRHQPTSQGIAAVSGGAARMAAFHGAPGAQSEPEIVPGAGLGREPGARFSISRMGGSVWGRGLGLGDAEKLFLRRPGDRQVEGADQAVRGQVRRLASQRRSPRRYRGPGPGDRPGCVRIAPAAGRPANRTASSRAPRTTRRKPRNSWGSMTGKAPLRHQFRGDSARCRANGRRGRLCSFTSEISNLSGRSSSLPRRLDPC